MCIGETGIVRQGGAIASNYLGEARGATAQLGDKSAGAAAEAFLAGYIKADAKNVEWVAKTPLATREF